MECILRQCFTVCRNSLLFLQMIERRRVDFGGYVIARLSPARHHNVA